jgi:Cyclin, N-terminal domain/Cyclin, C-terminal domain
MGVQCRGSVSIHIYVLEHACACGWGARSLQASLTLYLSLNCSFDLSREVVAVSLSLFDRYLATLGNRCNGNLALLTSLTTMHIAIKLHETKKIKLGTLANLSRGQFGPADIEHMEWTILSALKWKLHPPTQYAFLSMLLLFLPQDVPSVVRQGLHDVSMYLTELAVCDSYFVDVPSSTVAFAAILIVMEDTNICRLSVALRDSFFSTLSSKLKLYAHEGGVVDARYRLRKMFASTNMSFANLYSPPPPTQSAPYPHATPMPQQQQQYAYYGYGDTDTVYSSDDDDHSISSCMQHQQNQAAARNKSLHSRTSSYDGSSKSSCRYSPSLRPSFVASVSPVSCTSRAGISASPIVAGLQ